MTTKMAGAQIHWPSQANQIAPGTLLGWTMSPASARPGAPLLSAKPSPPDASSQPMMLAGKRLTRTAPAVANVSAARLNPNAVRGLFGPPARAVTSPAIRKTTETDQSAQTTVACHRAGHGRLAMLPTSGSLTLLKWAEFLVLVR